MALTKQCTTCLKTLPYERFSKNSAAKDGKQFSCKDCNKKTNRKFRTEINPHHHAQWQRKNPNRISELVSKYRKADKGGYVYYITNPEGLFYVGMTQMYPQVRFLEHKNRFRKVLRGQKSVKQPILDDSFRKWGLEGHRMGVILQFDSIDRKRLREYEKICIQEFMSMGISLNQKI